jgi:Reverse transcriptase (RNA-dependent DNA polymerase)
MYPLPRIDTILESLSNKRVSSKIELGEAYHQIGMDKDSKKFTTFICRYCCFCYNVMPFGLSVAPSFFQRLINSLLFEFVGEGVVAYLDDILIAPSAAEENYLLTCRVIEKLLLNNLRSRVQKCKFFQKKWNF